MRSLVNGPEQPFGLFVERHHHLVKSRQLGGDLSGDVGIRELLCAHSGILEERGQAETTSISTSGSRALRAQTIGLIFLVI